MAEADKTEAQVRREADYAATARLKEAHLPEFNELKSREMRARGIEWSPKPTDEEKAAAAVQELLAKHPGLRDTILNTGTPSPVVSTPDNPA